MNFLCRAAPLPVDALADIAASVSIRECWQAHARIDVEHRHHVRLFGTDEYEAWLLGWAPGQHVGMHDHGDAAGAFYVVAGQLREEVPRRRGAVNVLRTGATGVIERGELHDVGNSSSAAALSIHVYSPPLETMTFYDATGQAALRTEAVANDLAVG